MGQNEGNRSQEEYAANIQLNHRGMPPLPRSESDSKRHNEDVEKQIEADVELPKGVARGIDKGIDKLPRKVATQLNNRHGVGRLLVRLVRHEGIVDCPTQSLTQLGEIGNPD